MPDSGRGCSGARHISRAASCGCQEEVLGLEESTDFSEKASPEQAAENRGQQSGMVGKEECWSHGHRAGDRRVRHPRASKGQLWRESE